MVGLNPLFVRPGESTEVSRYRIPEDESLPETAYQIVHDEAMLDGNARLNLATFVGTWMDDHADRLYAEAFDKNMVDKDEYPATAAVEARCAVMLADLWHAPDPQHTIGTSTIGSSEAAMLGGLALKRKWQHARRAAGKPVDAPNLVMSSAVQVCWEKFCNYFEVEARYVPIDLDHKVLDGGDLASTSTRTPSAWSRSWVSPTPGCTNRLNRFRQRWMRSQADSGLDVPIHVDGASGAMIAPFIQPDLVWDFRLPRVASINTSGHKYGLVYPGLGWVVWRDTAALPDDLVFRVSYLGGDMPTLALNFSRPGSAGVAAVLPVPPARLQWIRRGPAGNPGRRRLPGRADRSDGAVRAVERRHRHPGLRLVTASRVHGELEPVPPVGRLRIRGWLVPAYPMPANLTDVTVQRVVVRNGLSRDLAGRFIEDLRAEVDYLDDLAGPMPPERAHPSFAH